MPVTSPQGTLDFKKVDKITFVGASSNTVIDTTTGSVGIGVVGDALSSNLHVVGDTRMEGNINMLHTSNTASIKLNSNVVTEFPRSKKLIKYPRVAMTQNDESATSGYVAGRSTVYQNSPATEAWKMFDGDLSTIWHSENSTGYWNTDGTYDGDSELVTGHPGEYVTLQLPANEKVQLHGIRVFPRGLRSIGQSAGAAPKDVVVIGSNNGSSWNIIATTTLTNYSFGSLFPSTSTPVGEEYVPATFDFEAMEHYQYVGLIIKTIYPGTHPHVHAAISNLEFLGVPEYDPEAHGVDVVVKSVPNVSNTDWLEVYYDAKDLADGTTTVNDLKPSGTANNGVANGNLSVSDGAFTFDGSGDYISTSITTSMTVHTASMWIQFDSPSVWECVYSIGPSSGLDRNNFNLYTNNTYFRLESVGNTGPYFDFIYDFEIGKWVHLTLVFRGTGLEDCEMYINNERLLPRNDSRNSLDDITITGTNNVYIGSDIGNSYYHDGKIANFRLFNRALTSDEIWQLYAYQKEYFGRGDLGMTLKAGRLGIGTSEPRAMLDVQGELNVSSYIKYDSAWFHAYDGDSVGTLSFASYTGFAPFNKVRAGSKHFTVSNSTTGGFYTAPVDGIYHFETSVLNFPSNRTSISAIWFSINGDTTEGNSIGYNRKHNVQTQTHLDASSTFRLIKGDIVKVMVKNIDCFTDNYLGWFSGFLVTRI
tara:strand:+ start:2777 stop:4885 length:2109 start_codon:yes stop_codon:yes gene_type:complete